jgi:putative DNA primase/helicase
VRDYCVQGAEHQISVDELYARWRSWAEDGGHAKSTKQVFGRDLRAAVPRVRVVRPRDGDARQRVYVGVGLRAAS